MTKTLQQNLVTLVNLSANCPSANWRPPPPPTSTSSTIFFQQTNTLTGKLTASL